MSNYSEIEDQLLLSALKDDSRTAFHSLFRKYYSLLVSFVGQIVSPEDAEEIVEDVMLWLWDNRGKIEIKKSLSSYLIKMAKNRALNAVASLKASRRADAQFYSEHQLISEVDPYLVKELALHISEAVEAIPEPFKTAFKSHRFEGLSYNEIAQRTGVSPKTIDYRIQQAHKFLRVYLKDYLPLALIIHFLGL